MLSSSLFSSSLRTPSSRRPLSFAKMSAASPALRVAAPALAPRLASLLVCVASFGSNFGVSEPEAERKTAGPFSFRTFRVNLFRADSLSSPPRFPLSETSATSPSNTGLRIARAPPERRQGRLRPEIPATKGCEGRFRAQVDRHFFLFFPTKSCVESRANSPRHFFRRRRSPRLRWDRPMRSARMSGAPGQSFAD